MPEANIPAEQEVASDNRAREDEAGTSAVATTGND